MINELFLFQNEVKFGFNQMCLQANVKKRKEVFAIGQDSFFKTKGVVLEVILQSDIK